MLNSFSRAKSALIMLLKDMIILYLPDKQTNITKPVNSDFMILFYLCLRKCDFELPRLDTVAHGRHLLRYQGPFIWSKVSSELRNLTSLKAFKKDIRGVDLSSHIDNNSNYCDLCKFLSRGHLYIVLDFR